MSADVAATFDRLLADLRARLDPMGCVDYETGAFQTGHVPHVGKHAYLVICRHRGGQQTVRWAEQEIGYRVGPTGQEVRRRLHPDYAAVLARTNGANILGVCMFGSLHKDLATAPGQPVGIHYQNLYKPRWIPKDHLGFGAINGRRYSQGHLYLAATGEVHLYHRDADLIGKTWPSLAAFLDDEIRRRLTLYDDDWRECPDAKRLPGDTDDWEEIAQAAAQAQGLP